MGLETLGVPTEIKHHSNSWHKFFVHVPVKLTATIVEGIFHICYSSVPGNIKHKKERATITFWRDFLRDVEGDIICYSRIKFNFSCSCAQPALSC